MIEVKMFETILPGGAILRAGIGAEFACCGPIIGEVWESAEGTVRCTSCAKTADRLALGSRIAATTDATTHRLIGVQSAEYVDIDE